MTSEGACDKRKKKGQGGGGVVLCARRRPRNTSSDRARTYAFARIPPSFPPKERNTIVGGKKADWFADTSDQPLSHSSSSETTGASGGGGFAPAHGGSIGYCSGSAKNPKNDKRNNNGLHLLDEAVLKESSGFPVEFVAPLCKINLRGCSERLLPFALIEKRESSPSAPALRRPHSAQNVHESDVAQGRRRRDRSVKRSGDWDESSKHEVDTTCSHGGKNLFPTVARNSKVSKRANRCADQFADVVVANMADLNLEPLRRPRRRRQRTAVTPNYRTAYKSEAQDVDELKSLLSMSRRIFSDAGKLSSAESDSGALSTYFVDGESRPGSGGSGHKRDTALVVAAQEYRAVDRDTTKRCEGDRSPLDKLVAVCDGFDAACDLPRQSMVLTSNLRGSGTTRVSNNYRRNLPSKKQFSVDMFASVGGGPATRCRTDSGQATHRYAAKLVTSSMVSDANAARAKTAPDSQDVKKCDSTGSVDISNAAVGAPTLEPSATKVREVQFADEATPCTQNSATLVEGKHETPLLSDGNSGPMAVAGSESNGRYESVGGGETDNNAGCTQVLATQEITTHYNATEDHHVLDNPPLQEHLEENSGEAPHSHGTNNELVPLGTGAEELPVYAHEEEQLQQHQWVYDEAGALWYPATDGDGQAHGEADGGWRYDEHSATWYQDESAWHALQSHAPETTQSGGNTQPEAEVALAEGVVASLAEVGIEEEAAAIKTTTDGPRDNSAVPSRQKRVRRKGGRRIKPRNARFGVASRAVLLGDYDAKLKVNAREEIETPCQFYYSVRRGNNFLSSPCRVAK